MVSTDFLPSIGGVTQHIVEVAKAILARGDSLEVVAPAYASAWKDIWKPPYLETQQGIPVWRIPYVINRTVKFVTGQISSRISGRRFNKALLRRLHETKPEVVHWHALESRWHPMRDWSGSARVWTNHTSHFIVGLTSRRRAFYQTEAEQADEIIAPSEELCDLTASLAIPRERIHFIPNGVDCRRFSPAADAEVWRNQLHLKDGERAVLCPRRLERKNGVSYFIQAAILLLRQGCKNTRFVTAGDFSGPKAESEEELVARLVSESGFDDRFTLLGRVQNQDMPGLYACSHVVVMPSLMEATSLSAMEAMATSKPIVSTDVGGLPFLVRNDENGLLVPPRDAARLAEAIKRVMDEPELAARFGMAGRARVERELDWSAIAESTRSIYRKAIERYTSSKAGTSGNR